MSRVYKKPLMLMLAALALAFVGYGLHVHAEGAPSTQPLWYAGTVQDNAGAPLTGDHKVSVRLFNVQSGAVALCSTGPSTVPFELGRFRVELNATCADVMRKTSDLFVEVAVDDESKPFP